MTTTTATAPGVEQIEQARRAFADAVVGQGDALPAYRAWLTAVRDYNREVDRRRRADAEVNEWQLQEAAKLTTLARDLGSLAQTVGRVVGVGSTRQPVLYSAEEHARRVADWQERLGRYLESCGQPADTSNVQPHPNAVPAPPFLTPDGSGLVEPRSYSAEVDAVLNAAAAGA